MIQRRHPLVRRTPLRRGTKRIRRRALRHAEEDRLYARLCRNYKRIHPRCQMVGTHCANPKGLQCLHNTQDVHHKAGRGRYLNDTSTWMPICRRCHQWVHENPHIAEELGYITRHPPPPQPHDPLYE